MIIRLGKKAVKVLLIIAAVITAVIGAIAARLAVGPVPIMWAVPLIEHAMQSAGGAAAALNMQDLFLAWDPDAHRVEFTAQHVIVAEQTSKLTAVEQVGVTFSTLALLEGKLQLKDLTLIAPHFQFVMGPNDTETPTVAKSSLISNNLLQHLHSVTMHGGILDLRHQDSTAHDLISHMELKWHRNLWASSGEFMADLQLAESKSPSTLHATLQENHSGIEINSELKNILPSDVGFILDHTAPDLVPMNLSLSRFELPVSVTTNVNLTPAGVLEKISGTITSTGGHILLPEYYDTAVSISALNIDGHYDARSGSWQVSKFTTSLQDTDGNMPLIVTIDGNRLLHNIRIDAGLQSITIASLKRWWPKVAAPGAIDWVNRNVKDGKIPHLTAAVDLHAADGINYDVTRAEGGFDLQNATTTFLPTMPAVSGINAKASIKDMDNIHFDILSGHLGDITLQPGTIDVSGLSADNQILKMDLPMTAQLPTALKLLDTPPYEYIKKMGVNAQTASGGVGLDLKMAFPLLAALKISDIQYRAIANLAQVNLPNVLMGRDVTHGQGVLEMTPDQLKITGQADLSGVPMEFIWQDFMAPKDNITRQIKFAADLIDDDYARLGLPPTWQVTGSAKLTGAYETRANKDGLQNILHSEMNFRDAAVRIHELSYQKPAGDEFKLTTDMTLGNPIGFKLSGVAKDLSVEGSGALDENFNPLVLNFPTLKVGSKTDAALKFAQQGKLQHITLSGNSFDLSQLIAAQATAPRDLTPSQTPPRWFQVKLGTVYLAGENSLKNLEADLTYNGRTWDKILLHGDLNQNLPVNINWDITAPGHKLSAHAADAGGVLAAFGITDGVIGGELTVEGTSDNPKTNPNDSWLAHGNVNIKNFRLRNIPLLGRLIAEVSPGELLDKLRGKDGVGFDSFTTQYEYSDNVLRLREGKIHGDSLGMTLEGDIHHAAVPKTLTINGTIVPLYMVNGALAGIPFIGDLINGKNGAGLLGFNYAASGAAEDPSVSVNPLSAFTPGFLRDLFFSNSTLPKPETK